MKYKLPPEPIRTSVKEAIHSVEMECGKFTPEEAADFERIASGEITTEEYRAEILAEIRLSRFQTKNGE